MTRYQSQSRSCITNLFSLWYSNLASLTELLLLVFYWLSMAVRPLNLRELQLAIAIEPSDLFLEEIKLLSSPSESITKIRGFLIRILSDDTVVLVHQSLTDYLLSKHAPELEASRKIRLPIIPTEANSLVTSTCLTYLSFDCFNTAYSPKADSNYPFLQYAACDWYLHVVRTGKRISLFRSVAQFLYSEQGFNWLYGLQKLFKKSVGELLVIQSSVCQWAEQYRHQDMPDISNFVPALYHRKIKEIHVASNNDTDRLALMSSFADIVQATGNLDQAERLYKQVLGFTSLSTAEAIPSPENVVGPENQLTLSTMANLASVYQSQGRWKEAENLEINSEI